MKLQCRTIRPETEAVAASVPVLHDLRFSALLGVAAWLALPPAVRERFSKRLQPGMAVTYAGSITESSRSWIGALVAQACRLVGAPLPLRDDIAVPAVVTVTEDGAHGGQFWTRVYGRARGFPQVIHSSEQFRGSTGLEEYLGCGVSIALTLHGDAEGLHFRSHHYVLELGGLRLCLPPWAGPGTLTISHVDRGGGWFAFILDLRHPVFGRLLHQTSVFRERNRLCQ